MPRNHTALDEHPCKPRKPEDFTRMGAEICRIALSIFAECGAPADFCVQHLDSKSSGGSTPLICFGGWNRVWLSPAGWEASRSHCSKEFISKFENLGIGKVV